YSACLSEKRYRAASCKSMGVRSGRRIAECARPRAQKYTAAGSVYVLTATIAHPHDWTFLQSRTAALQQRRTFFEHLSAMPLQVCWKSRRLNRMGKHPCRAALAASLLLANPGSPARAESPAVETARRLNEAFIEVADRVSPSVVVIEVAHLPDYQESDETENPLLD